MSSSAPKTSLKPEASRPSAATSGQVNSQEIERVSSLKVNRPRSALLISHFMKPLIQMLSGTTKPRGYFAAQGRYSTAA